PPGPRGDQGGLAALLLQGRVPGGGGAGPGGPRQQAPAEGASVRPLNWGGEFAAAPAPTGRLAKEWGVCHKPPLEFSGRPRPRSGLEERGRSSVVEHNLAKVGVES